MQSETKHFGYVREGFSLSKPKVLVERHVWQKMFGWCRAANSECSGMGHAVMEPEGIRVYDVFFPRQYCSSGYTEMDELALDQLKYKLYKKKQDPTHFRFWWHTHYNFGTFWSGTDHDNAKRLTRNSGTWMLSIVINQAGNSLARFDQINPFEIFIDELPIFIIPNSRWHKRKRNFKADIRKWVHDLSENRNKPIPMTNDLIETKPTVVTPEVATGSEGQADWTQRGYEDRWGNGSAWFSHWQEEMERELGSRDTPPETKPEETVADQQLEQVKDDTQIKLINEKEPPTVKTAVGDFAFGTKVVWCNALQKLIPVAKYEIYKKCPCSHTVDWEGCICDTECDCCLERLSIKMGVE